MHPWRAHNLSTSRAVLGDFLGARRAPTLGLAVAQPASSFGRRAFSQIGVLTRQGHSDGVPSPKLGVLTRQAHSDGVGAAWPVAPSTLASTIAAGTDCVAYAG